MFEATIDYMARTKPVSDIFFKKIKRRVKKRKRREVRGREWREEREGKGKPERLLSQPHNEQS